MSYGFRCAGNATAWRFSLRHTACYVRHTTLASRTTYFTEDDMGKYFLAWILGVPASLLVLIYLFTHIF